MPTTATDKKLDFNSDDETIADVKNGIVRGKKEGRCKITVSSKEGDFSAIVDVTVRKNVLTVSKGFAFSDEGYGEYRFASISEALSAAEDGDEIKVESGVYEEYVNVTKNVTLFGDGAKLVGTLAIGNPTLDRPVRQVTISDFAFSYNGITPCVVIGNESKNVTISSCSFSSKGALGTAISTVTSGEASAITDIRVVDCSFSDFENAVLFKKYVAKGELVDLKVSATQYAFCLEGSQKTTIKNCETIDSGFIRFKAAQVLPSDVILSGNIVGGSFDGKPIILARNGDIEKSCKINLSKNYIFGKLVSEMTASEIAGLKESIEVKNAVTGEGDYKAFIFE